MIIVKLKGGLGNQMFQYAIGLRLSLDNQTQLKLDISSYKNDKLRTYKLEFFNINSEVANQKEIRNVLFKSSLNYQLFKLLKKSFFLRGLVKEKESYVYDPSIIESKNNIYLDGYWQHPKYFNNIRSILLKELSLKTRLNKQALTLANEIKNTQAVSIHFRRTDYIDNKKTNEILGTCNKEYYRKAIQSLKNKINNFKLYVFSDDILWVKENIKFLTHPRYSDSNLKDYEEFYLMSLCKHNIIANSTFSWWAAWLNKNSEKIVIAPKNWTNLNKKVEIVPNTWTKI